MWEVFNLSVLWTRYVPLKKSFSGSLVLWNYNRLLWRVVSWFSSVHWGKLFFIFPIHLSQTFSSNLIIKRRQKKRKAFVQFFIFYFPLRLKFLCPCNRICIFSTHIFDDIRIKRNFYNSSMEIYCTFLDRKLGR